MKKSPGRKAGESTKNPVNLYEAAEIVGGLDELKRLCANENTWKTWDRTKLVPADRVIRTLLTWWRARRNLIEQIRREERARIIAEISRSSPAEEMPP